MFVGRSCFVKGRGSLLVRAWKLLFWLKLIAPMPIHLLINGLLLELLKVLLTGWRLKDITKLLKLIVIVRSMFKERCHRVYTRSIDQEIYTCRLTELLRSHPLLDLIRRCYCSSEMNHRHLMIFSESNESLQNAVTVFSE